MSNNRLLKYIKQQINRFNERINDAIHVWEDTFVVVGLY